MQDTTADVCVTHDIPHLVGQRALEPYDPQVMVMMVTSSAVPDQHHILFMFAIDTQMMHQHTNGVLYQFVPKNVVMKTLWKNSEKRVSQIQIYKNDVQVA